MGKRTKPGVPFLATQRTHYEALTLAQVLAVLPDDEARIKVIFGDNNLRITQDSFTTLPHRVAIYDRLTKLEDWLESEKRNKDRKSVQVVRRVLEDELYP